MLVLEVPHDMCHVPFQMGTWRDTLAVSQQRTDRVRPLPGAAPGCWGFTDEYGATKCACRLVYAVRHTPDLPCVRVCVRACWGRALTGSRARPPSAPLLELAPLALLSFLVSSRHTRRSALPPGYRGGSWCRFVSLCGNPHTRSSI